MRVLALIGATILASGCAFQATVTPREYLDEQTAATITVVAEPWVFNREYDGAQRDFINLYAIDVNRMGDHRTYLVVANYWPDRALQDMRPVLEISTGDLSLSLRAFDGEPRQIGVGGALDPKIPRSAQYWFYPIDTESLVAMATGEGLIVALVKGEERVPYVVWRDGSAELKAFVKEMGWGESREAM